MAFKITQKIHGKEYQYEVTKYWDPVAKKSKQRRKYLGVLQKDGAVTNPYKTIKIKSIRDYGAVYVLEHFAKKSKLKEILQVIFPKDYINILNLVYFKIIEHKPYYLFHPWSEGSYLYEGEPLISQDLTDFTKSLGEDEDLHKRFFKEWVKEHGSSETLIFDITSISSHSKYNSWLEWGYNRDGESLPQINLGAIVSQDLGLPLAYRFSPGSITDVVTLKNTAFFANDLGIKKVKFVLDKGFFSKANIDLLIKNQLEFTIPLAFTTKEAKQLINNSITDLQKATNSFHHQSDLIYHTKREIELNSNKVNAHIFLNTSRQKEQISNFLLKLNQFEDSITLKKYNKEELEDVLVSNSYNKFFTLTEKGLVKNDSEINLHCLDMGKIILLTNHDIAGKELMDMYLNKDVVEKYFDTMKNELDEKRLRVSSKDIFSGRLFITFIALILRSYLGNVSNKASLNKTFTLPEIFSKLKLIRHVTKEDGGYYLTEISKHQRLIFEKLGVPLPS